jgi:hypothetical protein
MRIYIYHPLSVAVIFAKNPGFLRVLRDANNCFLNG